MRSRTYIIGRQGDIHLSDDTVSRQHAELVVLGDDERYYLTDLGSTSGTFLLEQGKRHRFTQGFVDPEQEVAFGECIMTLRAMLRLAEPLDGVMGRASPGAAIAQPEPLNTDHDERVSGPRKLCGACGHVILVDAHACPSCGEEQ